MIIHFVVFSLFFFFSGTISYRSLAAETGLLHTSLQHAHIKEESGTILGESSSPLYPRGVVFSWDRQVFMATKKSDGGRERNVLKWRGDKQTLGKPEASSMYLQTHNAFIKTLQGLHAVSLNAKVLKWTPGCRMPGSAPFTLWHFLPYSLHPGHSALSCSSCAKHTNPGPL